MVDFGCGMCEYKYGEENSMSDFMTSRKYVSRRTYPPAICATGGGIETKGACEREAK